MNIVTSQLINRRPLPAPQVDPSVKTGRSEGTTPAASSAEQASAIFCKVRAAVRRDTSAGAGTIGPKPSSAGLKTLKTQFHMEYLGRGYQAVSNMIKTQHETTKNTLPNLR